MHVSNPVLHTLFFMVWGCELGCNTVYCRLTWSSETNIAHYCGGYLLITSAIQCTLYFMQCLQLAQILASFPGRSHLQYLIAYSMQIRRGKAWEIWSRVVTWSRQKVDTWGAVPDEESRSPFTCTIGSRAGGQSVSKEVSIPSVVHSARDGSTRNGNYYCRAPPPVCLPSVYLM